MNIDSIDAKIDSISANVFNELGPGFHESIYQNAMEVELRLSGTPYEAHPHLPILYKSYQVGFHIPDIVVDNCVVELKVQPSSIPNAFEQLKRYVDNSQNKYTRGKLVYFGKKLQIFNYTSGQQHVQKNKQEKNEKNEQDITVEQDTIVEQENEEVLFVPLDC